MLVSSILSSYSRLLMGASLAFAAVLLAGCNEKVAEKPEPTRPVLVATVLLRRLIRPRRLLDVGWWLETKPARPVIALPDCRPLHPKPRSKHLILVKSEK